MPVKILGIIVPNILVFGMRYQDYILLVIALGFTASLIVSGLFVLNRLFKSEDE
jgi:hypothetical protein